MTYWEFVTQSEEELMLFIFGAALAFFALSIALINVLFWVKGKFK